MLGFVVVALRAAFVDTLYRPNECNRQTDRRTEGQNVVQCPIVYRRAVKTHVMQALCTIVTLHDN